MGLLNDIQQQNRTGTQKGCSIQKLLDQMDSQDKKDLINALDDPSITHASITFVLKERGHILSLSGVSRHRKGLCGCPR